MSDNYKRSHVKWCSQTDHLGFNDLPPFMHIVHLKGLYVTICSYLY